MLANDCDQDKKTFSSSSIQYSRLTKKINLRIVAKHHIQHVVKIVHEKALLFVFIVCIITR